MEQEIIEPGSASPSRKGWRQALEERSDVFASALPDDVKLETFMAVVKQAVAQIDGLEECLSVNPKSAFTALLSCARDGLVPDGRQAHIDVRRCKHYGKQAAYMPMVQGLIERLYRSGNIKSINCRVVREGDDFTPDVTPGTPLRHVLGGGAGKVTHVYCVVVTKDGGEHREIMFAEEIERHRKCASTGFVWNKWPEAMARKTVLRQACKLLDLSSSDRRMVNESVEAFADLNQIAVEAVEAPALLKLGAPTEDAGEFTEADILGESYDDPSTQYDDDFNPIDTEAA